MPGPRRRRAPAGFQLSPLAVTISVPSSFSVGSFLGHLLHATFHTVHRRVLGPHAVGNDSRCTAGGTQTGVLCVCTKRPPQFTKDEIAKTVCVGSSPKVKTSDEAAALSAPPDNWRRPRLKTNDLSLCYSSILSGTTRRYVSSRIAVQYEPERSRNSNRYRARRLRRLLAHLRRKRGSHRFRRIFSKYRIFLK